MKIKSFVITAVLATAILCFGSGVKAQTTDIQAQIAQLQEQIQVLMQQIAALQSQQDTTSVWCHTFNKNLRIGDNSSEVEHLVSALVKNGVFSTASGSYYDFDENLASAVVEFQEKYALEILTPNGLKHGNGYAGPGTRKKLNALYGCKIEPKYCTQDAKQCSDGSYVSRTGPNCEFAKCPETKCTDYDGGKDYYTKGSIYWINEQEKQQYSEDKCPSVGDPNYGVLQEVYCTEDGLSAGIGFVCPNGCENGACKQVTTQPFVTIISPNGGETYKTGDTITVNWKTANVSSSQKFDIIRLRAYPNGQEYNLASSVLNDGQELITLPSSVPVGAYTLEIKTYVDNVLVFDASDSYFKIVPLAAQCTSDADCPSVCPTCGPYSTNAQGVGATCAGPCIISKCVEGKCVSQTQPSISSFWTDKTSYAVGDPIVYRAKVVNADGTPFVPQTGTDVMFTSIAPGITVSNGGNSMTYDSTTGYYGFKTNPIPSTMQTGIWTAYAWAVKNGTQVAVSEKTYFSVTSSAQPSITVTSPTANTTYIVGNTMPIVWTSTGLPANAMLSIGINGDGQTSTMAGAQIATNISASNGIYSWTIPVFLGENLAGKRYSTYVICLNCSSSVGYSSQNYFTIGAGQNLVTASYATLIGNQSSYTPGQTIKFSMKGVASDGNPGTSDKGFNVQAYICKNGDCNNYLTPNPAGSYNGTYNASTGYWDVSMTAPSDTTANYKMKATFYCSRTSEWAQQYGQTANCSQGQLEKTFDFTISSSIQPSITVTSPNGGETWKVGETHNIIWTSSGVNNVKVMWYAHDSSGNPLSPMAGTLLNLDSNGVGQSIPASTGKYSWTIGSTAPEKQILSEANGANIKAKISVLDASGGTVYNTNYFTIVAPTVGLNISQSSLASISDIIQRIAQQIQALMAK